MNQQSLAVIRRVSSIACLALAAGFAPAFADDTKQADEAAAIRWLKTSAHPLMHAASSSDDLQPLVAALDAAQVIGIGEATHGSHEDWAFKADLIKALIEQGRVDLVVLEANRQIGADLDGYVVGRGGDLPTLLRSPSLFRNLRTEEFADLMVWIRAWNIQAAEPVHVLGIDCQDGGVDAEAALAFVRARDRRLAKPFENAFGSLTAKKSPSRFAVWANSANTVDYAKAMKASERLDKLFETHRDAWLSAPGYQEAAYAAKVAREAFDAFALENGRGDPEKDAMEYYGRRDRYMAANLLEQLDGRRAVFSAHDMHVLAELPANWPIGLTWVGCEVRRVLGERYQTVTFAWSRGAFRAQTQTGDPAEEVAHRKPLVPQTLPNDRPEDLGGVLVQAGFERFWADLRTLPEEPWAQRFAATPYPRGWAGWRVDAKTWNQDVSDLASLRPATDILVWFEQITPSHMLPGDDF